MNILDFFGKLVDTAGFPARWNCGTAWTPFLGWLHILSDLAIFGAYFAIPLSLLFFVFRRRDVPLRGVFWLFAAFILSCGVTHLIEAIIFWEPVYRLSGLAKFITAVISWTTVIALVRVMPDALSLPGVRTANEKLIAEISKREELELKLTEARDHLERRSAQLTQRDRRTRLAMEAADACALRWAVETNEIHWHLGGEHSLKLLERGHRPFDSWDALLSDDDANRLRDEARRAIAENAQFEVEFLLDHTTPRGAKVRLAACPDEAPGEDARHMIGMFRIILQRDTCDV